MKGVHISRERHEHGEGVISGEAARAFILPSARPKTSSFGRDSGQQMHVIEDACWNLLQIDFLSPHSWPSL